MRVLLCLQLTWNVRFNWNMDNFKFNYLSPGQLVNLNLDKIFLPLLKILPCYQAFLAEVSITLVISGHWRFNRWLWPLKEGKLSPRGLGACPQKKKIKSRSSEMRFPTFWASKSVPLMRIFIDNKAGFFWQTINFFMPKGSFSIPF